MEVVKNNLLVVKDDSKRVRKSNAVKLPPQINESMIPKYVVYYKECYNREKMLFREFFKIEKHAKLTTNRVYTSSKSNKINILDKLEQIKNILENIENDFNEETIDEEEVQKITLPKYVSLKKHERDNEKYYLIFDKKIGENRQTYKTLCNNKLTISQNLDEFLKKINEKYCLN
tara:strand:- start:4671 stop:5192 length:522 start_codon:yes stop_codon:yes gene_type:complete